MVDHKPPRLVDDERTTVLALLQYQRESLVKKLSGISEDAARSSPVPSGTSLLWLIQHLTNAESLWILHRFAGQVAEVDPRVSAPEVSVEAAIAGYRAMWDRTNAVIEAASSLSQPCIVPVDEGMLSLRWVLMHLLEETARHAGHADIIREVIDGEVGR